MLLPYEVSIHWPSRVLPFPDRRACAAPPQSLAALAALGTGAECPTTMPAMRHPQMRLVLRPTDPVFGRVGICVLAKQAKVASSPGSNGEGRGKGRVISASPISRKQSESAFKKASCRSVNVFLSSWKTIINIHCTTIR